jgi:hypothetical protein
MDIRLVNDSDYEMFRSWWEGWGWTPPPKDFLPNIGVVVNECAAGFLYVSNSKVCWVDWIISDKNYRGEDRDEIINMVLASLEEISKDYDAKFLYSLIKHEKLMEKYESMGYVKGDSDAVVMIKHI